MTDPKLPDGWETVIDPFYSGTAIGNRNLFKRIGIVRDSVAIDNYTTHVRSSANVAAVLAVIDANGLNTTADELRDKLDKAKSAADVPRCKTCPCRLLLDNGQFCTVWVSYKMAHNENGYCSFHPDARK